jgi:tRNA-specific 2-thiouridylase
MYHTLGQRQGLGIGGLSNYNEDPWYVAKKDLSRNVLIAVQGGNHPLLFCDALIASKLDWVNHAPVDGTKLMAKTRYRQPDQACTVTTLEDGRLQVVFDEPQRAVTPGQSVVFYEGEVCLGGGIIESTYDI